MEQTVKSSVIKNCLNPTYNEKFTFSLTKEDQDQKLLFVVKDWDAISKDDFLGQV